MVQSAIQKLDTSKAPGPDNINNHLPCARKRGGGVALVHASPITVLSFKDVSGAAHEGFLASLSWLHHTMTVLGVYRPPGSSIPTFMDEFSELLGNTLTNHSNLLIAGDFNLHMDVPTDPHATRLTTLLNDVNFCSAYSRTHAHQRPYA